MEGFCPVKLSNCAVSLHPDRGRRCRRQPEDSVRPGVSLHGRPEAQSVLCNTGPRHVQRLSPWMTYTEPLSGAAGVGWFQLDTCWFGRAPGGIRLLQRAPSHGGCRPAPEQLTSAKQIGRGRSASRRYCVRGELTPQWKFLGLTAKVCPANKRHHLQQRNFTDILEVPGAHMMYTITRGPSKLATQRRTGRYRPMMQRDITRLLRLHQSWLLIQRLSWIIVRSWDVWGRFWTVFFFFLGPTQQIESKFSDLKLKPTSWLSTK